MGISPQITVTPPPHGCTWQMFRVALHRRRGHGPEALDASGTFLGALRKVLLRGGGGGGGTRLLGDTGLERMCFPQWVFSMTFTSKISKFVWLLRTWARVMNYHSFELSHRATGTCREWCFQSFLLAEFSAHEIWHQPKLHAVIYGKSLKITIDLYQVWLPPNRVI